MDIPEPIVVISRCIEFDYVRYDGQIISSPFVRQILPFIKAIPVCPEVEIGLGVPRDTLRLVKRNKEVCLIQPSTEKDLTEKMRDFAEDFLSSLNCVDGFILKNRSPSSAIKDANIYAKLRNAPSIGRGAGIFGGAVLERFSHLAIEDEGRLRNGRIREHFLRKIFTLARFRSTLQKGEIRELIQFHTQNKLLLKAYNQEELRIMGRIVANQDKNPIEKVYKKYEQHLYSSLEKGSACKANINVLMNSMGYFSDRLSKEEKNLFLDQLEKYRNGRLPLVSPMSIMKSWITRFSEPYLNSQTFFKPYPEELMTIDSVIEACGERDYWDW